MSAAEFCWSTDEENFHGRFDTREEALAMAKADAWNQHAPGETATVWTGEIRKAEHFLRGREHSIGDRVVEQIDEWLIDEIASDEVIVEIDKEAKTELGRLIIDFLAKRASFNRWGVAAIETHEVTVPPGEAA